MATTVKHRINFLPALRRHPWRALAGLVVLALAVGAGGYAIYFYHHLHAAEQAAGRYDFDEAPDQLAICIRLWPQRSDLRLLAARTARRGGRFGDADHHLDDYERLAGKTPDYLLENAMLHVQQGEIREYGPYLLKLLQDDPPQATLILEALAQGSYRVFLMGAAKNYAEKALQREPGNVPMLLVLGILWDGATNFDEAEKDFRDAVQAQPGHAQARLELAQFLLRRQQVEEAADHFEQLRARHYQMPAVLLGLALCRRQQARTREERELLDSLLADSPDNAAALGERGRLELEASELEAAERDLRAAVSLAPFDREATFHLARCLERRGKDEESAAYTAQLKRYEAEMKRLKELVEEIGKKPNDAELHRQAGIICQRNGLDRQAERWLLGALQIDPRYKPAYQSLADFYTHIGRPDLAARYGDPAR